MMGQHNMVPAITKAPELFHQPNASGAMRTLAGFKLAASGRMHLLLLNFR
jgi:hypothetical protein